MSKKVLISIFVLIILSALFFKVRASLPAVKAEGEELSWQEFSAHRAGLARFRDLSKENISDKEIEAGVITSFVEDALVKKELENMGKSKEDVRRVLSEGIEETKLEKLEEATSQLYGWSMDDFEKFILYPQARKSLLLTELEKNKIEPEAWLENSLNNAKISVYLWNWKWSNGEVKERF